MQFFFSSAWDVLLRLAGAAAGMLGSWSEGIKALGILMAADYFTGLFVALFGKSRKSASGKLSARAGFLGLLRKGLMLLVVLVAALADQFTGGTGMLQNMAVGFYICNEGISVLGNIALLGVPIPTKLKNALDVLKTPDEPQKTAQKKTAERKPSRSPSK